MAKKGAALEQLVALIQDTLKDGQDNSVKTNEKIVDTSGIVREADVLVSTKEQEKIRQIAFECKDYSKKRVDIQVVDAVIGKYKYLPQIHKKVLVSATGFTHNAIKRANDEDITWSYLEELPLDTSFSGTEIFNPKLKYYFYKMPIIVPKIDKVDLECDACCDWYIGSDKSGFDFWEEAEQQFEAYPREPLIERFIKNGREPFWVSLDYRVDADDLYLRNEEGKRISIEKVRVFAMIDFEMEEGTIVKQQKFVKGMQQKSGQGKDVIIIENKFENNNKPYSAVIMESDNKWGAGHKINGQYIKSPIRIKC